MRDERPQQMRPSVDQVRQRIRAQRPSRKVGHASLGIGNAAWPATRIPGATLGETPVRIARGAKRDQDQPIEIAQFRVRRTGDNRKDPRRSSSGSRPRRPRLRERNGAHLPDHSFTFSRQTTSFRKKLVPADGSARRPDVLPRPFEVLRKPAKNARTRYYRRNPLHCVIWGNPHAGIISYNFIKR